MICPILPQICLFLNTFHLLTKKSPAAMNHGGRRSQNLYKQAQRSYLCKFQELTAYPSPADMATSKAAIDLRITRLQWRDRVGITPNFPNLTLRHL